MIIPFTHERKRQSILIQNPTGKFELYTKGIDKVVLPRLKGNLNTNEIKKLKEFGKEGLRTIVFGKKDLSEQEINEFL